MQTLVAWRVREQHRSTLARRISIGKRGPLCFLANRKPTTVGMSSGSGHRPPVTAALCKPGGTRSEQRDHDPQPRGPLTGGGFHEMQGQQPRGQLTGGGFHETRQLTYHGPAAH